MYAKYLKRVLDFCLSLLAIVILSPLLLILTIVGVIAMGGDPFFTQERPGKDEKRLTAYGKWLRGTSLDELLELFNILKGDMSFVGPRPLLVRYLERYNAEQHRRHEVRPGLTGLAQANGRNTLTWEDKFRYDVEYVDNITFAGDVDIILKTIVNVLKHEGISSKTSATMEEFEGTEEARSDILFKKTSAE